MRNIYGKSAFSIFTFEDICRILIKANNRVRMYIYRYALKFPEKGGVLMADRSINRPILLDLRRITCSRYRKSRPGRIMRELLRC